MVLNTTKAAELLQISKSTLYKWVSKGLVPYYKPNGKILYFKKEELENWLTKNRVPTISEQLIAFANAGGSNE